MSAASKVITVEPKLDQYLAMTVPDLASRFAIGVEVMDQRVFKLRDEQLDMAFLPDAGVGRWPIRVLLGHLADAEMVLTHRMRCIAAQENPILHNWDENAFIDAGIYGTERTPPELRQPIGAYIATIYTLRKWTSDWLRSLAPTAWERKGLHTERGEMTLKTILTYDTWHLDHHAWFLNRKVAKLIGPG